MPGISAVFSLDDPTTKTFYGLFQTHHRGQGSCGISSGCDDSIRTYSSNGFMQTVFPEKIMNLIVHPNDYASLGHVGRGSENERQIPPIEVDSKNYKLAVAMDGIIFNRSNIDKRLGTTGTDEEMFGRIFSRYLEGCGDIETSAHKTMKKLDNAYFSLAMLVLDKNNRETKLLGIRDKRGVRPMYMGRKDANLILSSESGAVDVLERIEGNKMKERRDVEPGELIVAGKDEIYTKQIMPSTPAHCVFEWVYTSRPDSVMNGVNAHEVRKELGRRLVRLHGIKDDGKSLVGGVPDSGRSVALGISKESDIPFDEVIIKNQYVGRTYIIKDPKKRSTSAFLKHNNINDIVKGKNVIIGDDSIVRGTISDEISKILKNAGAEKVTFAVSYAPIFEPCFEDEPNKKLTAAGLEKLDIYEIGERVAKNLPSIDKVIYNDVDSVVGAVGLPKNQFCTKCISCKNPFKA